MLVCMCLCMHTHTPFIFSKCVLHIILQKNLRNHSHALINVSKKIKQICSSPAMHLSHPWPHKQKARLAFPPATWVSACPLERPPSRGHPVCLSSPSSWKCCLQFSSGAMLMLWLHNFVSVSRPHTDDKGYMLLAHQSSWKSSLNTAQLCTRLFRRLWCLW